MKINRFLFPLIALAIFALVVGGAMILGFWQTKGGQHRGGGGGHEEGALSSAIEMVAPAPGLVQWSGEVTL